MASVVNVNHAELRRDIQDVRDGVSNSGLKGLKSVAKFLIQEKNTITIRIVRESVRWAAGGTLAGMVVGAAFGCILSPTLIKGGASAGASAGGAVGCAVGGIAGVTVKVVKVVQSEAYQKWRDQAVANSVYPIFEKYLRDNMPPELLCPYTSSLIAVPVKVKKSGHNDDHLFEQAEVIKDLARSNGVIKCPHCTLPVTEADIVYDNTYHRRVMLRLHPLLESATADPTLVAAAQAFQKQAKQQAAQMIQAEVESDGDLIDVLSCKNEKEREKALEKLKQKYGTLTDKYKLS